jgi:regulation of enolase protein 1 (concanavalin A-like superfamily)
MTDIPWNRGKWTNQPAAVVEHAGDLLVTAAEGSDAWRVTSYGFIHDTEHALLVPFAQDSAMEVQFTAAFSQQFDQAGIFVRVNAEHWIKAGVEFVDGSTQLGAVVTDRFSDWSLAPVPEWNGGLVRMRVSRSGGALTIRAASVDNELQLVRVVPMAPSLIAVAGPFTCAPTRAGLIVPFHSWRASPSDSQLH